MSDFLTRPLRVADWQEATDLYGRTFGAADLFATLLSAPFFDIESVRGGFYRKRLVTMVRARFHQLHYGRSVWRVGMISGMATDNAWQRRGFGNAVMQDVLAYIAVGGAQLALLNTDISGFYGRFGFSAWIPDYALSVATGDMPRMPAGIRVMSATPDDARALAALYHQHWHSRVTFSREAALWRYRVEVTPPQIALNPHGGIEGYLWRHPTDNTRAEFVAQTPQAALALVTVDAAQTHTDFLTYGMPPDDVIVSFLRPHLDITLSARYRPARGWLARLVDSAGFVAALVHEVTTYLRETGAAHAEHTSIHAQSEHIELRYGTQRVQLLQRDFLQLVFSAVTVETLLVQGRINATQAGWLSQMFPQRLACVGAWDW